MKRIACEAERPRKDARAGVPLQGGIEVALWTNKKPPDLRGPGVPIRPLAVTYSRMA